MRKVWKKLAEVFLFFLAGILLFSRIAEILRKKSHDYADTIQSFYELEENTLDVLFLGSSHAYSSIGPVYLWEEYGLTSYVLGSQEQTAAVSYYLLLDALQYQEPEIVVFETYYLFWRESYTDQGALRSVLDGMPFDRVKVQAVETLLGDLSFKDRLSWYLPFLKYHSRWADLEDYDFHSFTYLKGGYQDYTADEMEEPELSGEAVELPDISREYLGKIIDLCEERQIELVLYCAPFCADGEDTGSFERKTGMQYTVREIAEERGIPFLWYQEGNPAGIDYAADFRDWGHLNTYGTRKLTEHLGAYLTENYDLPDHRGDEAYSSWDEDYAKYMEREAELTGDEG